ncbi:MAG: hypothetical protein LUF92_08315 [Clostridiales bacterium]|nr:hypothetical protein [Clostridiales bacterium]
MKRSHKFLRITPFLVLAFILLFGFSINTQAASKKSKALKAYKKVLSQSMIYAPNVGEYVSASECSFAIAYIDNNSVPELVICYGSYTWGAAGDSILYTYKNGKVKYVSVSGIAQYFVYSKKKGIVRTYFPSDDPAYSDYSYYRLKKAKLKSIKASTAKKTLKKNKTKLKLYANTAKNRKKYLK